MTKAPATTDFGRRGPKVEQRGPGPGFRSGPNCAEGELAAGRGGVARGQVGGDPPALGHRQALGPGPLPDARGFTAAAPTGPAPPVAGAPGRPTAAAATGHPDVGREAVAQLAAVLLADVDLVGRPVE